MKSSRWATTIVAAAVCVLCGACGGGSSGSSSSKDPRSSEQVAADKTAAEAAVLKAADLPPGWDAKPNPETAKTADQKEAEQHFAQCAGVDPSVVGAGTTSVAHARSDEFSDGSDHQVEGSVTVVATTGLAQQELNAFKAPAVPTCLTGFVNRAVAAALANPRDGTPPPTGVTFGDAHVEQLSLPGIGTDSVAYRATLPAAVAGSGSVAVTLDLVLALKGRAGVSMTFTSFGTPLPTDLEVELTNKVLDRSPAT